MHEQAAHMKSFGLSDEKILQLAKQLIESDSKLSELDALRKAISQLKRKLQLATNEK